MTLPDVHTCSAYFTRHAFGSDTQSNVDQYIIPGRLSEKRLF